MEIVEEIFAKIDAIIKIVIEFLKSIIPEQESAE